MVADHQGRRHQRAGTINACCGSSLIPVELLTCPNSMLGLTISASGVPVGCWLNLSGIHPNWWGWSMRCFAAVPNVVFAIPFCRRTLFVGALFVTLAGCACPAPLQVATDGCISPGCLRRTAAVEAPLEVKPAPPRQAKPKSQSATTAKTAKLTPVAAKPEKPVSPQTPAPAGASEEKAGSKMTLQSVQPSTATTWTTVGTKMDAPVSGQPSETSDSILSKTKNEAKSA
jgi:hypothetical protein